MSCDHLPLETQLEGTKENKGKQKTRLQHVSEPQESDEDSGDEYDLHYKPLAPVSPAGSNKRCAGPEMEPEYRPPPVSLRVSVPATPPVHRFAGEQLEELNTPVENLPGEETNLPTENLPDDHSPSASPSSNAAAEPEELTFQLPPRERRPPRRITYDQLGVPSCYSIQPPSQLLPVNPGLGLVPWMPPLHPYYFQPPCMYGLRQT